MPRSDINTETSGSPFVCPKTHEVLLYDDNYLYTANNECTYPLVDNIPIFTNLDNFYENRWAITDMSTSSLRNLFVKKQRFFVQSLKGMKGSVLDIGCGGGWKLFTTVGPVTGVDLSLSSLKKARQIYSQVVLADSTMLPFSDNSFDFVVSSDVLGHVPYLEKTKVWSEIYRVLKPGGLTLHYIEADSSDPLMLWCKQDIELYQQYIIGQESHIGMETISETVKRFRNCGLEPIDEIGVYRLLMYLNRFPFLLDNEYRSKSHLINIIVSTSQALLLTSVTELFSNLIISFLMEITDKIFPENWSNGILVKYRKPSHA